MKISRCICMVLTQELFQTSSLISFITKILSLTHRKCRRKPKYEYFLLFYKYGRSELYRYQIFSHTIYLYNKKFDWLFIEDPIWLVWHTYISHSLIHWPVHNIPNAPTKRYFFYKEITQWWGCNYENKFSLATTRKDQLMGP